ncbi:hypothetical protein GCM10027277_20270 [Pseudoduganella ginsengisoli]|uniref:Uncharacterized protein n=1 Tax=Pseudoduganella ginsengisoli TaxID=1462440 RepID=A0A6L6PTF6_9BURK|nr:hypothetical protein [Pseudoduganella ginsengisoli]MTW00717.1 hypothetical protein [Pseudoduganella ginsengisoli]
MMNVFNSLEFMMSKSVYSDDNEQALARFGVAPGIVALHVEAARQVLREHQQVLRRDQEIVPSSISHPGPSGQMIMRVDGDARTIFELNFALEAKEAQLGIAKDAPFDIVFSERV